MFSMLPVDRSSMTNTSSPRLRYVSARCDPMKPDPPVIRTLNVSPSARRLSARRRIIRYGLIHRRHARLHARVDTVEIRRIETRRQRDVRGGRVELPLFEIRDAAVEIDFRAMIGGQRGGVLLDGVVVAAEDAL